MSMRIQLQASSVFHLPFQNYEKDFIFFVNKEIFNTSRIFADLLSPKISKLHQIDPTISSYSITTKSRGNFNTILSLMTFQSESIPESEISFLSEIIESLEISFEDIKIINTKENKQKENNWYHNLKKYLRFRPFFKIELDEELDRVSSEFYKLEPEEKKQFKTLPKDIVETILSNPKLQVESEDELIDFINELYTEDNEFFNLYSYVCFKNVSTTKMKEFVNIFSIDDMSHEIWESISNRLCEEIKKQEEETTRYKKNFNKEILYNNQEFDGIVNYLRKQTNIEDEINISYSSLSSGNVQNLFKYEDKNTRCFTNDSPNSWFCFEFKKHEIIPTNYTIRTYYGGPNATHLKNWKFEGSNDNKTWTTLDEETNCPYLNGSNFVHTFPIKNEKNESFKYLRIYQTGQTWQNDHNLLINCIELYGRLI